MSAPHGDAVPAVPTHAVKIISLLKRKPGLSFEEFVEHYENNHAPLILRYKGTWIQDYRRNYVRPGSNLTTMDGRMPDCDVVTEATFATVEDYEAYLQATLDSPEYRAIVIEDEEKFLDRDAIRFVRVDERVSPPATADQG